MLNNNLPISMFTNKKTSKTNFSRTNGIFVDPCKDQATECVFIYILLFSLVRLIGPRVIHLETVIIGLPFFAPTSASFSLSGLVSFHNFYIL